MLTRCAIAWIGYVRLAAALTGVCKPATWSNEGDAESVSTASDPIRTNTALFDSHSLRGNRDLEPGEVSCRQYGTTEGEVSPRSTCNELAVFYHFAVEKFYLINPELEPDCSNIAPYTQYCVAGVVQTNYNKELTCRPGSGYSCPIFGKICCNSRTWKCGDSWIDCAPGICYSGLCAGDKEFTTTGRCGAQHRSRKCSGPWGDCCSIDGFCGTGPDYCGVGRCQGGNCDNYMSSMQGYAAAQSSPIDSQDGTCGVSNGHKCNVVYGYCCSRRGECGGLNKHCKLSLGCQPLFGDCDNDIVGLSAASSP